jgi:hypothetical protein
MVHTQSKRLINAFAIVTGLFLSTFSSAQTFTAFEYYHTLLVGSTFKDTIFSSVDIRSMNSLQDPFGDVDINVRNLSNTSFELTFDFSKSGYQGKKLIEINTLDVLPTISKLHRYNFTLVRAIVVANDDFVKVEQGRGTLQIDPLANDAFNDPYPKRLVVSDTKFGKAVMKNGLVEYTLPENFESDVITYTVENITQVQSKAAIYLFKENAVKKDVIQSIVVSEKSSYVIILPTKFNGVIT